MDRWRRVILKMHGRLVPVAMKEAIAERVAFYHECKAYLAKEYGVDPITVTYAGMCRAH
jgi:hypothetical protein